MNPKTDRDYDSPNDREAVPCSVSRDSSDTREIRQTKGSQDHVDGYSHDSDSANAEAMEEFEAEQDKHLPVELAWQGLVYSVLAPKQTVKDKRTEGKSTTAFVESVGAADSKQESKRQKQRKIILHGVSGGVKPGELLAVMGTSGAGKTTLLNVLAGRTTTGYLEGNVLVNGAKVRQSVFKKMLGFVMQTDRMFAQLTVRETLQYHARFKLPKSVSDREADERVEQLISILGLRKCANALVGNELVKGCSGGEKRRLTIGLELIKFPSILFLDEPTTGLDSFMAHSVMTALRRLARRGYTIMCTIHQPRYTIYDMFDKLMLMTQGRVAYFGPAANAIAYFGEAGCVCPPFTNPADYLLDILTVDTRTEEARVTTQALVHQLLEFYERDQEAQRKLGDTSKTTAPAEVHSLTALEEDVEPPYFKRQLRALFDRAFRNMIRDYPAIIFKAGVQILFGLIIGAVYFQISDNDAGIADRLGLFFFIIVFELVMGFFSTDGVFRMERPIFYREKQTNAYPTLSYFVAKSLCELTVSLLMPIIFASIMYYMVGLDPAFVKFVEFVIVLELTTHTAESLGIAFSAIASTEEFGQLLRSVFLLFLILLGGYYTNGVDVFVWLRWIKYISFVYYSFNALVKIEFEGRTFCSDGVCRSGESILKSSNISGRPIWADCLLMLLMIFVFKVIIYLGLRFVKPKVE